MRGRIVLAALALATVVSFRALAEPPPGDDPLARFLYPPDRVLGHAQEIGLDDAQRKAIRAELQKSQSRFLDVQLDLQAEVEKMAQLVKEKPVDEARVLAQADRVFSLEREAKRTQLSLLIRIKNLLTPTQQTKLAELQGAKKK